MYAILSILSAFTISNANLFCLCTLWALRLATKAKAIIIRRLYTIVYRYATIRCIDGMDKPQIITNAKGYTI